MSQQKEEFSKRIDIPWSRCTPHRGQWQWLRKAKICCTSWASSCRQKVNKQTSLCTFRLQGTSLYTPNTAEVGWTIGRTRWSRGAPGKNQTGRNGLEEGASVASTQNVPKQDFCFQPTVVAPIQWCLDLSSLEFKSNFHSCSVAQANCTNISQRILPYCALNFNSLHWTFLEHCSDKSKYQKRYYQYFFFILFC